MIKFVHLAVKLKNINVQSSLEENNRGTDKSQFSI